MRAFEFIKEKLKKYPQVIYQETETFISVLPATNAGFTVSLEIEQDIFRVFYNGWHEDFKHEEEALNCFAFGLSDQCRLKEFRRNNEPYKWTLEYQDEESWVEDSTTGMFNISFWKEQTVNYLQNNLIK